MKSMVLAAAFLIGSTAAIAQDASTAAGSSTTTTTPAGPETQAPAPADGGAAPAPAPSDAGAAPSGSMSTGGSMAPSQGSTGAMSSSTNMQPTAATGDYPPCSRTVQDKCTNSGRGGSHGKMMHHKKTMKKG